MGIGQRHGVDDDDDGDIENAINYLIAFVWRYIPIDQCQNEETGGERVPNVRCKRISE